MHGLTIAEAARRGGVNVETIRYYERHGLVPKPPRTSSGYRLFAQDTVARLRFIKRAQKLGFTLAEIKELLGMRFKSGADCGHVKRRAEAKIAQIDQKISHLGQIRAALKEMTENCPGDGALDSCIIFQALEYEEEN